MFYNSSVTGRALELAFEQIVSLVAIERVRIRFRLDTTIHNNNIVQYCCHDDASSNTLVFGLVVFDPPDRRRIKEWPNRLANQPANQPTIRTWRNEFDKSYNFILKQICKCQRSGVKRRSRWKNAKNFESKRWRGTSKRQQSIEDTWERSDFRSKFLVLKFLFGTFCSKSKLENCSRTIVRKKDLRLAEEDA